MQDKMYKSNGGYVLREIAGEAVLVSIGSGVADFRGVVKLNPTAKCLWKGLMEGATAEKLAKDLAEEFDVEPENAAGDVNNTLEMLLERGMITCE